MKTIATIVILAIAAVAVGNLFGAAFEAAEAEYENAQY